MENLDIKNFSRLTGVNINDYLLFATQSGKDGKLQLSMLIDYLVNLSQPYIDEDTGTWKARARGGSSIDTGIPAEGKTPVLKKGNQSSAAILWKYSDEPDSKYRPLVEWSDIRVNVGDLTQEQLYQMKLKYADLTEADKEDLRSVYNDILVRCQNATESAQNVVQKTNEAATNANNAASGANQAKDNANQAATNANTAAQRVTDAITDISAEKQAAKEATQNANTAAENANNKATLANNIYNTAKNWYDSVSPAWTNWFNSTKTAWNNWFSDTLATGTRKIWNDWFSNVKSLWATLKSNVETATQNANDKATLANNKATLANEKAEYANEQGTYAKNQGDYAKEIGDKPPYIGSDGYWYNYNYSQKKYVKTEIYAKGGATFVEFSINPETLECEVNVPEDQVGTFVLDEDGQVYIVTD